MSLLEESVNDVEEKPVVLQLGKLFIIYAIICLMTSWVVGGTSAELIDQNMSGNSVVGPIDNRKASSVYLVKLYQNLGNRASNYISIDVLNSNKEFLFAFGKELWWEEGYDSDGRWSEGTKELEMKITLKDLGNHYFRVSPDKSVGNMRIVIKSRKGSSLPHTTLGIISLAIAFVLMLLHYRNEIINSMPGD